LFRDFTPAILIGAFDFGNGLSGPDQPYQINPEKITIISDLASPTLSAEHPLVTKHNPFPT